MKKRFIFFIAVFIGIMFVLASEPGAKIVNINDLDLSGKPGDIKPGTSVKADINFGKIPLYFITNMGQVNERAKFYAKASRYTLWLTKQGLVFDSTRKVEVKAKVEERPTHPLTSLKHLPHSPNSIERDVSRLMFIGADKNPEMVPMDETELRVNYFIGNDKSKWHCDIPTSMAVLYKNLYKNIA